MDLEHDREEVAVKDSWAPVEQVWPPKSSPFFGILSFQLAYFLLFFFNLLFLFCQVLVRAQTSSSPTRIEPVPGTVAQSFRHLDHQEVPVLCFLSYLQLPIDFGPEERHAPGTSKGVGPDSFPLLGLSAFHAEGNRQETVQSPFDACGKLLTSTAPFLNSGSTGFLSLTTQPAVASFPKSSCESVCVRRGLCWSFCFVWVVWAYILQVDGWFPEGKGSPYFGSLLQCRAEIQFLGSK